MQPVDDPLLRTRWVSALADLVRDRLGYVLPAHRTIREIAPFLVAEAGVRGIEDPEVLVAALREGHEHALWESLVDLATIGETHFFRHPAQIQALVEQTARRGRRLGRPLRIWSAGCATGEEPLTVAMRLEVEGVACEITASDISTAALARASAGGPFSERSVGHLSESYRERWLVPDPTRGWRLRTKARPPVRYVRHNLAKDAPLRPSDGPWDVILCRNVVIYLSREQGAEVLARLASTLSADGCLWIAPTDQVVLKDGALAWACEGRERFLRPRRAGDSSDACPLPAARARPPRVWSHASGPGPGVWTDELASHVARGLASGARDLVEQRLEAHPEDGTAWVARAALHLRDHAFEEALGALERARDARPRPEGLAYLRGTTQLKAGRPAEALASFLRALEDDPDDWASAWQAADLYRRRGRILLEELMLRRAGELLEPEPRRSPSLGPAAGLVNSVHLDPEGARRLVLERLDRLGRISGRVAGEESSS